MVLLAVVLWYSCALVELVLLGFIHLGLSLSGPLPSVSCTAAGGARDWGPGTPEAIHVSGTPGAGVSGIAQFNLHQV